MTSMPLLSGRDPRLPDAVGSIDVVVVVVVVVVVTPVVIVTPVVVVTVPHPIAGVMVLRQQMMKTDVEVRSDLEAEHPDEDRQQCEGTADRFSFGLGLG